MFITKIYYLKTSRYFTWCMMLLAASLIAVADDAVLRDISEIPVQKFTLDGDKSETALLPLWITDLDNGDANENGHWLFERDGVIYIVTEMYGAEYDAVLRVRRFDSTTGEMLLAPEEEPVVDFSLPETIKRADWPNAIPKSDVVATAVITDEDNTPIVVTLRHKVSGNQTSGTGTIDIVLSTFDFENNNVVVEAEYPSYFNSADIVYGRYATRYIGNIANVKGTLATGTFSFEFAHGTTSDNYDTDLHTYFFFTQKPSSAEAGYTGMISDTSNLSTQMINGKKNDEHFRIINRIDDNSLLISTAPNELMLATVPNEIIADASDDEPYSFDFVENLFSENFANVAPNDNSGYCFEPVRHGDKTLWVSARDYSENTGVKFNVMKWPDKSSFANLASLASIPDDQFKFPKPYYARSARLIAHGGATTTDANGSLTTPLTLYSPGSGIARYQLVTQSDNSHTGIGEAGSLATETLYTLRDGYIELSCEINTYHIADLQGRRLIAGHAADGGNSGIDTSHLAPGIYLLSLTTKQKSVTTVKIML